MYFTYFMTDGVKISMIHIFESSPKSQDIHEPHFHITSHFILLINRNSK